VSDAPPQDPNSADLGSSASRRSHLRAAGVSLVLDWSGPGLPHVPYWGPDLGRPDASQLAAMALLAGRPRVSDSPDELAPVELLPAHASGWMGLPGILGSRDGADWSPLLSLTDVRVDVSPPATEDPAAGTDGGGPGGRIEIDASDAAAGLGVRIEVELTAQGLVRLRAHLRNAGATAYQVDGVHLALPVPSRTTELLDLTGRHLRERAPQLTPFALGQRVQDNRRGRTGADATLILAATTPGTGFRSGECWGMHVGWSGNHRTYAERLPAGDSVLGAGELLQPGEVSLAPGETYSSPWVYGAYGRGLDDLSARFHAYLRARPSHPHSPRPVVLNTWESVYFDHDLDRLKGLADAAAEVGVERYVLDDGWFRHRRDDTAGLGDWYVDEQVWPDGLHPLVEHVTSLGMEFGLWVEPEMINLDSDLARAHPDWVLGVGGRTPIPHRHQQVLDLGNPEAYRYILDRLTELLDRYDIAFLKWDHNRDLTDAGSPQTGRASIHTQTLAVYHLLDELRAAYPGLEIESCSSGGARVDLGVLERTDRVWASDCIDALERQGIQRWTGLLLPPELVGAHVGSDVAHTTGRRHTLGFRAATALFGHLGVEWDIASAAPEQRAELARWIALYKQHRAMLHSGVTVRSDHPDPALLVHGIVARDGSEALYAVVSVATSLFAPPGRVTLPGLRPDAAYRVELTPPGDQLAGVHRSLPGWVGADVVATGRILGNFGIEAPAMFPEHAVLVRVRLDTAPR
jgi:alpha-galactosidase